MLNENIKYFRKKKGYTQETLAGELDVVRQTVSKWEKGYSVPDAVMLERIADLFEISVSELLGDNQENPEKNLDLKRISEQLSILNSQFAKELSRKRRNRKKKNPKRKRKKSVRNACNSSISKINRLRKNANANASNKIKWTSMMRAIKKVNQTRTKNVLSA